MAKTKLLKAKDIRKKSDKDLINLLRETQINLTKNTFTLSTNKQKNTNILSGYKKTIARVKTVLKEKRILKSLETKNIKN